MVKTSANTNYNSPYLLNRVLGSVFRSDVYFGFDFIHSRLHYLATKLELKCPEFSGYFGFKASKSEPAYHYDQFYEKSSTKMKMLFSTNSTNFELIYKKL